MLWLRKKSSRSGSKSVLSRHGRWRCKDFKYESQFLHLPRKQITLWLGLVESSHRQDARLTSPRNEAVLRGVLEVNLVVSLLLNLTCEVLQRHCSIHYVFMILLVSLV